MSLSKLSGAYERAVTRNADAVAHAEQLLKVLILVMPAQFGIKSEHKAQAACSAVNLLSLYNRLVALRGISTLDGAAPPPPGLADVAPEAVPALAWASAVEHVALFAEMYSARKLGGNRARWTAITAVEVVRAALQLRLLWFARGDLVARHHLTQAIAPLPTSDEEQRAMLVARNARTTVTYEESRWWDSAVSAKRSGVPTLRTLAEILRIFRPILTLGMMHRFGAKSWKTWAVSLIVDVLSRILHNSARRGLNPTQRAELVRRDYLLLMYLLWSPCFESIFGNKAAVWLHVHLMRIPVIKSVTKFVSQFVTLYRRHYFNLSFL